MSELQVWTEVTVYTVCAVPKTNLQWYAWSITVESRGDDRWAVCHHGMTMTKTGRWRYERSNSSRTEGYLKFHRHDLDTALRLAQEYAPKVTVNGLTPADALEWHATDNAGRDAIRARVRARYEKSKRLREELSG